jgi:hypothetical protein
MSDKLPPLPESEHLFHDAIALKSEFFYTERQMRAYARAALAAAQPAQAFTDYEERLIRDDESKRWRSMADALQSHVLEIDTRYMALLKACTDGSMLKAPPAILMQAPQQPLTLSDERIQEIADDIMGCSAMRAYRLQFARAVLAAAQEKQI